jgi:hypothetical protein
MGETSVFITSPTGLRYEIRADVCHELRGDDLLYLGRAADRDVPIAYIKLEPGMFVTFGSEPPEIHDGREGWAGERRAEAGPWNDPTWLRRSRQTDAGS